MKKKFITVCAWCKDSQLKEKKLIEKGYTISHGICEECAKNHF